MLRIAFFSLLAFVSSASADDAGIRLKDLVTVEGVRANQLIGYGLVVGLNGTGDRQQTLFSAQSLTNLLLRMGVSVSAAQITVKNTAAVIVTATLPAYAQPGSALDVTVAAVGDATNLQGGLLVLTTLRSVNGEVFAMAQGPVVTGGFVAGRNSANSQTVNHPTVGRVPNGATVERPAPSVPIGKVLHLQLKDADFTTASRIADVINQRLGSGHSIAHADNSALVSVEVPTTQINDPIKFMSQLEMLAVRPDHMARVVVNERTGTIVLGANVRIAPVAVMHGNLSVSIETTYQGIPSSDPQAQPTVVPQTTVNSTDEKSRNIVLQEGATVEQLVKALTSIGSTTRDVIAILENLRAAGALDADLEVI